VTPKWSDKASKEGKEMVKLSMRSLRLTMNGERQGSILTKLMENLTK